MASVHQCGACGNRKSMEHFKNQRFTIEHGALRKEVDRLSGWRCQECDEVEFDPESAVRYAAAGDELVLEARKREQMELRRIRQKLDLSQQAAAIITGGGHNAFSRYERGAARPLPAVMNLFRLLDRHPELLREILPEGTKRHDDKAQHKNVASDRKRAKLVEA